MIQSSLQHSGGLLVAFLSRNARGWAFRVGREHRDDHRQEHLTSVEDVPVVDRHRKVSIKCHHEVQLDAGGNEQHSSRPPLRDLVDLVVMDTTDLDGFPVSMAGGTAHGLRGDTGRESCDQRASCFRLKC